MASRATASRIAHSHFMIIKLEYIMALGIQNMKRLQSAANLDTFHATTEGGGGKCLHILHL